MIRQLTSVSDPAFVRLLCLYNETFPPETREPDERLVEEIEGKFRVPFRFLVWEGNGFGFIRFTKLDADYGFVIHIAVEPDAQRQGIGMKLLDAAHKTIGRSLPLLAEVEDGEPLHWWIDKANAEIVTSTYTQPAIRTDTDPVPLNLTVRGDCDLRQAILDFYREIWELDESDPFVQKALAGIAK